VVAAVYRAFGSGDHERALAAQRALTPLAAAVTSTYGVAGLKMAMDLSGRRGGFLRGPLLPAPEAVRTQIQSLLATAETAGG
jgi:dihydrodipicolinate synthase/N-acetylneuraminate lyase